MFSYKAAVAVKELGFENIRIYNGGIKDWKKSGYPLESVQPLPMAAVEYVDTDSFYKMVRDFEKNDCRGAGNTPLMTILDFRNGNHLSDGEVPPQIETSCPVQMYLLDDILQEEIRAKIPHDGLAVTITETGNRDEFVIRYLSQYGFDSLKALKFGMRGWLKQRYPTR